MIAESALGYTKSRITHPSNRLYYGECTDFRDAVRTYIAALEYEERLFTDDDDFNRESKAMFQKTIADAREALAEYNATIGAAEKALFEKWQHEGSAERRVIAEAAIDGDYTGLAI